MSEQRAVAAEFVRRMTDLRDKGERRLEYFQQAFDWYIGNSSPWTVAEDIAQARREGVLIGVRAGIEAAIAKMEKMGEQWRIEGNEYRERGQSVHVEVAVTQQQAYESSAAMIRALDPNAIAACKGGSGE